MHEKCLNSYERAHATDSTGLNANGDKDERRQGRTCTEAINSHSFVSFLFSWFGISPLIRVSIRTCDFRANAWHCNLYKMYVKRNSVNAQHWAKKHQMHNMHSGGNFGFDRARESGGRRASRKCKPPKIKSIEIVEWCRCALQRSRRPPLIKAAKQQTCSSLSFCIVHRKARTTEKCLCNGRHGNRCRLLSGSHSYSFCICSTRKMRAESESTWSPQFLPYIWLSTSGYALNKILRFGLAFVPFVSLSGWCIFNVRHGKCVSAAVPRVFALILLISFF